MKNSMLKFGLYATLILLLANVIPWAIWGTEMDYGWGEVLGYSAMLAAMSMVFFGIRHYRDLQNGGKLSIGEGIKIGLLIALIPSLAFGLYNYVFMEFWAPEFMESYMKYSLEQTHGEMSVAAFEAKMAEMKAESGWMLNSVFQSFVMFMTVFVIGALVAIISAVVLRNKADAVPAA